MDILAGRVFTSKISFQMYNTFLYKLHVSVTESLCTITGTSSIVWETMALKIILSCLSNKKNGGLTF